MYADQTRTVDRCPLPILAIAVLMCLSVWLSKQFHLACIIEKCSLLSPSVYKGRYQRIVFYWSPAPSCPPLFLSSYLVFCDGEGAQTSEDPTHPYQWLPFIWCHWQYRLWKMEFKKKKVNWANQKCRINWVEMELLLLGKENIVLIERLNCFGEMKNEGTYAWVVLVEIKLMH